jgi:hypothetical protein
VVTPEDPLPVVEDVLRRYDVRWLILERAFMTRDMAPVLAGTVRPDWLSTPLLTVMAPGTASPSSSQLPDAALYAVCLAPDDRRCAS